MELRTIEQMKENEIQGRKFLNWINENLDSQKTKLMAFCLNKKYDWDEDIFSDCIVKIYDKILKKKLEDESDKGFEGYLFCTFKQNLHREKLYARNLKRDENNANISALNEMFLNQKLTQEEKLLSDLRKDFTTLYLMQKVEENFDAEHFYLFRLKTFTGMTYRQLYEHTGIKGARTKVVAVKNWLKENVTKQEVDKVFNALYGNIL